MRVGACVCTFMYLCVCRSMCVNVCDVCGVCNCVHVHVRDVTSTMHQINLSLCIHMSHQSLHHKGIHCTTR